MKRDIPYTIIQTIIQTMKTNKVPITMYNVSQRLGTNNPEYEYDFFDDTHV